MATKDKKSETQQTGTGLATTTAGGMALGGAASPTGTGLATTPQSADDLALTDLFGGTDLGGLDDGLGELAGEDIKVALKVWNMGGLDPETKRQRPKDSFFDTVSETMSDELQLVLLDMRKTNEWRQFIQAESKTIVHCRSDDRVHGTMRDSGEVRECKTCPDAQWRKDEKGKPFRNCGPVYAIAALDLATQQLCVLRFKSLSLAVIRAHLNKHHIGRRTLPTGRKGNWPLYAFTVRARLRMDEGGQFSHIELERTGVCTPEILAQALEAKRFFVEIKSLGNLAEKDLEAGGESPVDTSFDPEKIIDTHGKPSSTAAEENLGFADQ